MFINKLLKGMAALVAVLVIASCNKEPDLIGLDLLPAGDRLNMSDTVTSNIIAYSVREDALSTKNLSSNLLGYLNDPVFGPVKASFYTQYRLPLSNISFGENPVADSIVFTLVYSGVYGDSLAQHTVKVFELDESLGDVSDTLQYYSTSTKQVLPTPIGEATFVPNLIKADSVDGKFVKPHLRVTLTQEFANKILSSGPDTLSSNKFFSAIFKGLFIDVAPVTSGSPGSILHFDMLHEMSRVALYYHNNKDTTSIKFPINSSCMRFNNYNHYGFASAAPELLQQFAGDTAIMHQQVFLQSMGGSKVKLKIPFLDDFPQNDKKIAVNEALLIFTDSEPENIFKAPGQLSLRAMSDTGTYMVLPDELLGSNYFGGRYVGKKEYKFRITKYVQDRMMYPDLPDNGLMLLIPGGALTANRLILNGPGHPTDRMKLVIYYTIIE